ncbi:hypothetical protein C1J00_12535, partial [Streptomyces cahuitamycinicus]
PGLTRTGREPALRASGGHPFRLVSVVVQPLTHTVRPVILGAGRCARTDATSGVVTGAHGDRPPPHDP